jgi:hypothetical protein
MMHLSWVQILTKTGIINESQGRAHHVTTFTPDINADRRSLVSGDNTHLTSLFHH